MPANQPTERAKANGATGSAKADPDHTRRDEGETGEAVLGRPWPPPPTSRTGDIRAPGTGRNRVRLATAGALALALLAGVGCTSSGEGGGGGSGGGGDDGDDRPRPPRLAKQWSVPAKFDGHTGTNMSQSRAKPWVGQGVLAVPDGASLRGYDATSGKPRWKLDLPRGIGSVCGMSEEATEDGTVALALSEAAEDDDGGEGDDSGEGDGEAADGPGSCQHIGALDVRKGELRWTEKVGALDDGDPEDTPLSAGHGALTVTLRCEEVRQYRPRDGKLLNTPLKRDKACAHETYHAGGYLAAREVPAGGAKEKEPGWIPPDDSAPASFVFYKGARKKPLWRTKAPRLGGKMHRILAEKPLTLDTSTNGHRVTRTFDSDGKPMRTLGKSQKSHAVGGYAFPPLSAERTLVLGYQQAPSLYAYDLDTGKVRWKQPKDEVRPLGTRKGELLAMRPVRGSGGSTEQRVVSFGMRSGEERVLGRTPAQQASSHVPPTVAGDRLYSTVNSGRGGRVEAYRLPDEGERKSQYGKPAKPDSTSPDTDSPNAAARNWRRGDLRPDSVERACEAVSPTARKDARVYRAKLPPPLDCSWEERYSPRHTDRELKVEVTAHTPPESGKGTATAQARKLFKNGGRADSSNSTGTANPFSDSHGLPKLGTEAKAAVSSATQGDMSSADVLVRYRNVTVLVSAEKDGKMQEYLSELPPQHRLESAAHRAAADVLRKLGGPAPKPSETAGKPSGGSVTEAESSCAALRSQASTLVPDSERSVQTPKRGGNGRVTGCYWRSKQGVFPSLEVRTEAMPDSRLRGERATQAAKSTLKKAEGRKLSDLGDQARLKEDTLGEDSDDSTRVHTLTARRENLVVYVKYMAENRSKKEMSAEVRKAARTVLKAHE